MGGGPPPPPLTEAEELALSHNTGRPVAEGIPGVNSSKPITPQGTSAYIRCLCSLMVSLALLSLLPQQNPLQLMMKTRCLLPQRGIQKGLQRA
ncbi:hypothetical protein MATL_G00184500 [Megalops atlanticus]|uniref:Uncharacterized protein n=1 Tax=Megalops atlanticus TaxID=7932 RepID=A0A9D3T181_MEGAT|nr:hypothetical protein MATL_G00184500 [Megalops atlanticus]